MATTNAALSAISDYWNLRAEGYSLHTRDELEGDAGRRLAALFGRDLGSPWPDEAVRELTSTYQYFRSLYQRAGGSHLDATCGDALLAYLSYFPDERLLDTPPSIVVERLGRLWSELALAGARMWCW